WLDTFLKQLTKLGLATDDRAIAFVEALHGKVRFDQSLRVREGAQTLDLSADCRNRWSQSFLGHVMMNEAHSTRVDGQEVELSHPVGRYWGTNDLRETLRLPPLAPGRHRV